MRADPAAGYVPAVLRRAMFVQRQAPGRREPARASAGGFQAAGLPVPEQRGQRTIYQLTGGRGLAWTPGLDAQTGPVGHRIRAHPRHPASGHLPGWHLWYRADPARPVHLDPLGGCHAIELRTRGTCPGSPGYLVRSHPDELLALPPWLLGLAGPPPAPATATSTGHGGAHAQARLQGILRRLHADDDAIQHPVELLPGRRSSVNVLPASFRRGTRFS